MARPLCPWNTGPESADDPMEIRCPWCEKPVLVPGGGQFACSSCKALLAVDAPPAKKRERVALAPADMPPCRAHKDRAAIETCRVCGGFLCEDCTQDGACGDCAKRFATEAPGIPWELERRHLGFFKAWWRTGRLVLARPQEFFQRMPRSGSSLGGPIGFYALNATVFYGIVLVVTGAFTVLATAAGKRAPLPVTPPTPGLACLWFTGFGLALPLLTIVELAIEAALYHLLVLLVGGKHGFETTLRIVGYGTGPTKVLQLIPSIGGLANMVWNAIVTYHGFKAQGVPAGRALLVALTPLILVVCCMSIFITTLVAAFARGDFLGGRY